MAAIGGDDRESEAGCAGCAGGIGDGLRGRTAGDGPVADRPCVRRGARRSGGGIAGRAWANLRRRRGNARQGAAIRVSEAEGDITQSWCDGAVGGRQIGFVLEVALAVELTERRTAGGEECGARSVGSDEVEGT